MVPAGSYGDAALQPASPRDANAGELSSAARQLTAQGAGERLIAATGAGAGDKLAQLTVTYGVDLFENDSWFNDATTKFHFIKAWEYRLDSKFAARWPLAQQEGLRGAYCFGHPSYAAQAADFCRAVKNTGFDPARDRVALDHESTDGKTPSYCAGWAQDFCATVITELGTVPLVYSYENFITTGNCAGLGAYPLWLAYPAVAGQIAQLFPLGPWRSAALHQYAVTSIDWDCFLGSAAGLQAFWAAGRVAAQPVMHSWAVNGTQSLRGIASAHGTWPNLVLYWTLRGEKAYQPSLMHYIEAGNWDAPVPAGVTVFVKY